MRSVLGACRCVAFERIGKTVRIRRGPAAVSGDERYKLLVTSSSHCVRGRKSTTDRYADNEVGSTARKDMGRCDVRTIRESEDLPSQ